MNLRETVLFFGLALFSVPSQAATWYAFIVQSDQTLYYFDANTVVKSGPNVTVNVKYVNSKSYSRDTGAANATLKVAFNCASRTKQVLQSTAYAKNGSVVLSHATAEPATTVAPDSIDDTILRSVCQPDFPHLTHPDQYSAVPGNDIFQNAASFFAWVDDPPPDSATVWYAIPGAFDSGMYAYFSKDSVQKSNGNVILWLKMVRDSSLPDVGGTHSIAFKEKIDCQKKTRQNVASVDYDKAGTVTSLSRSLGSVESLTPGTAGGELVKIVCLPDFPQPTHPNLYFLAER